MSLRKVLACAFTRWFVDNASTNAAALAFCCAFSLAPLVGVVGVLDLLVSLAVTTSLFALGKWPVGPYLARSTVPNAFGAAASFAALLLWLYYTAQIFLFGAEVTACLGRLTRRKPEIGAREDYVAPARLGRNGAGK